MTCWFLKNSSLVFVLVALVGLLEVLVTDLLHCRHVDGDDRGGVADEWTSSLSCDGVGWVVSCRVMDWVRSLGLRVGV